VREANLKNLFEQVLIEINPFGRLLKYNVLFYFSGFAIKIISSKINIPI
jgi:hypothetical protein